MCNSQKHISCFHIWTYNRLSSHYFTDGNTEINYICPSVPVTQSFATSFLFIVSSICLYLMLQYFIDRCGCCGCNRIYDASLQQHLT